MLKNAMVFEEYNLLVGFVEIKILDVLVLVN